MRLSTPVTGPRPRLFSHAIWLYFRFPLRLRMVEEMLAGRTAGISRLFR
jgi:hypothetical protein